MSDDLESAKQLLTDVRVWQFSLRILLDTQERISVEFGNRKKVLNNRRTIELFDAAKHRFLDVILSTAFPEPPPAYNDLIEVDLAALVKLEQWLIAYITIISSGDDVPVSPTEFANISGIGVPQASKLATPLTLKAARFARKSRDGRRRPSGKAEDDDSVKAKMLKAEAETKPKRRL